MTASITAVDQQARTARSRVLTLTLFAIASIVNGLLLWHFHDRYWYPTDDGLYANIAERLLNGEVLNAGVQDIHPGYIHFLHAAAFRTFGIDIVSLRYPLMLVAFVHGCLVFGLLQRRDVLLAAFASVAVIALGVIQFVDPTPNWYCLCLCVAIACWMAWIPSKRPARLIGAGFLLGVMVLLRQLSGGWAAMAVLVVALLEGKTEAGDRRPWLARALLLIMLAGIVLYLAVSPETEPGGVLLVALWPIGILAWALFNVRTTNRAASTAVAQLAIGAVVPALPLFLYHVAHGSLGGWVSDTVLSAFGETQMSFFGRGWYGVLPLAAFQQIVTASDAVKIANGLYWVVVPLLSAVNGLYVLTRLRQHHSMDELVLPILAAFYALVSLYLEGPLYLYYAVGLTLVAVCWLNATGSRARRMIWVAITAGLSLVAILFHAGQSRLRTPVEILQGDRVSNVWGSGEGGLIRCSLRLEAADRDVYGRLVNVIQRETRADESILALPNDAELYFLASRRNPVRFYNSALGIRTDEELRGVIQGLTTHPPRLVAFRPDDKYNTDASRQVMDLVRREYVRIDAIGGLELYRREGP